jgi:hypothetical protein
MEVSVQLHAPTALPPVPVMYWKGSVVGPRTGLDTVEWRKVPCPCRQSYPGRPAGKPSLYRLSYLGFQTKRPDPYAQLFIKYELFLDLLCFLAEPVWSCQYSNPCSLGTRLWAGWLQYRGSILENAKLVHRRVQKDSVSHTFSYPVGDGSLLLGYSRRSMKPTTRLYLVPRLRMVELHLHSPHIFMSWCLIKHGINFNL